MVTTVLLILAAIVVIPVLLVFVWKMLQLFLAIVVDLGGLVFAVVVFAIITTIFMLL